MTMTTDDVLAAERRIDESDMAVALRLAREATTTEAGAYAWWTKPENERKRSRPPPSSRLPSGASPANCCFTES
jgi:hypothetical protein